MGGKRTKGLSEPPNQTCPTRLSSDAPAPLPHSGCRNFGTPLRGLRPLLAAGAGRMGLWIYLANRRYDRRSGRPPSWHHPSWQRQIPSQELLGAPRRSIQLERQVQRHSGQRSLTSASHSPSQRVDSVLPGQLLRRFRRRSSSFPAEEFLDVAVGELYPGGTAVVALARMGGDLHLAEQSIHLGDGEEAAGADRAVARHGRRDMVDFLLQ